MKTNLWTRLRMLILIAGALVFCAPVWSDVPVLGGAAGTERMCYCDCDAKAGSPMCMHVCNLAKYQDRSWATSCHKPAPNDAEEPSTSPKAHSTKDNRVQDARL